MDTSFWTKLSPKIVEVTTTKQYFNRYLYKMVVEVYGGRLIQTRPGESIADALSERIANQRIRNYGGSWWNHRLNEIIAANPKHLELIRSVKEQYKNDVKIRVEEPQIQIYAETEDMLKVIATALGSEIQPKILSVSCPAPGTEQLLENGKIIMRGLRRLKYNYKVMVRDGAYPPEVKQRVLEYLTSLGEKECLISGATARMLHSPSPYMWSCFFYVNDDKILTFVKLIAPDMIGKIHELIHVA